MSEEKQTRRHKSRLFLFGLFLLSIMCLIFYMSAQNDDASSSMSRGVWSSWLGQILDRFLPRLISQNGEISLRKYAHLGEFFLLGVSSFLFIYELFWEKERRLRKTVLAAWLWGVLYSCSDEWHQTFIPGRSGQICDVLLDSIGVVAAIACLSLFAWIRERKHRQG